MSPKHSEPAVRQAAEANPVRTPDHDFIVIAPHNRRRNLILAGFLADPGRFVYHTLTASDAADPDLVTHLLGSFPTLTGVRYLVLDEADRLDPAHLAQFAQDLQAALPAAGRSKIQIVLNPRFLDYRVWQPLIEAGRATLLSDEADAYTKPAPSAQIEVYALGGGAVYSDGLPVTVWDGPLPRNLFYYFIDHPLITREEVFAEFWPSLPAKDATNVYHVTKRKVTERAGHESTIYSSGFYRTAPNVNIYYDVTAFESAIAEGRRTPDDNATWTRAIKLYRGAYLHGLSMSWIVRRRSQLATDYTEALIELARNLRENDAQHAIGLYLRALREMPHREDIHRDVMRLYAEAGHPEAVQAQYAMLTTELKRAFNIAPSRATQEFYQSLNGRARR